jgi:secondary thiamine-phosphate synthase enzyme
MKAAGSVRYIRVSSRSRTELIDITADVKRIVGESGVKTGICHLSAMHTTAGITINEGADPDVQRDLLNFLNNLVPASFPFHHAEGNSDAHVKSSLVGSGQTIIIDDGTLVLGTWQAVYFCEFDGPRSSRKVAVKILSDLS